LTSKIVSSIIFYLLSVTHCWSRTDTLHLWVNSTENGCFGFVSHLEVSITALNHSNFPITRIEYIMEDTILLVNIPST
jgi:hypothetical protein